MYKCISSDTSDGAAVKEGEHSCYTQHFGFLQGVFMLCCRSFLLGLVGLRVSSYFWLETLFFFFFKASIQSTSKWSWRKEGLFSLLSNKTSLKHAWRGQAATNGTRAAKLNHLKATGEENNWASLYHSKISVTTHNGAVFPPWAKKSKRKKNGKNTAFHFGVSLADS